MLRVDDRLSVSSFVPDVFPGYVRVLNPAWSGSDKRLSWKSLMPDSSGEPWIEWSDVLSSADEESLAKVFREPLMGGIDPQVASVISRLLEAHSSSLELTYLQWEGYCDVDFSTASELKFTVPPDRVMRCMEGSLRDFVNPSGLTRGRIPLYWVPEDLSWAIGADIYARSILVGGGSQDDYYAAVVWRGQSKVAASFRAFNDACAG